MYSACSVALVVTTVGVPLAVVYQASRRNSSQGALLGNSLLQAAVLTVLVVVGAALFYESLARAFGHGHGGRTWILVAVLVPLTFLCWTTTGQLQGMLLFGRYNVVMVVSRVAYAVGVLAFVGVLGLGVAGGVVAYAAGYLAAIAGALGPILARGRAKVDRALLRRTLSYGSRVQIGSVFQLTNGRLDVIILQLFRPLSQVGYYVVAESVAELVLNLAGAFQNSVLPLISHFEGDARAETTSIDSIRHHGILAAAAVLANAVIGVLVIFFAFGSQFHRAIAPMLILLPGIWFLGTGIVVQGDLSGRGRPGTSSLLAGVAAGVTVAADLLLIPPLGVFGGALASDLAYTVYGVGSLFALHRVSGISVRRLVVPTRSDFASYRKVARTLSVRAISALRSSESGSAAQ